MPPTREMVTLPSSKGWRSTSIAGRANSGSSSKNSTPLWAREISPGCGEGPPPASPAVEMVWWGARKGLVRRRDTPAGSFPRMECILVVSKDSSKVISGKMVGRRLASMLLPEPGGPMSSTLWQPLAAISRARLAYGWPFTSAKSRDSMASASP